MKILYCFIRKKRIEMSIMNLKELRLSKKLSQEKAAELLGITRRTYIKYEQGKVDLSNKKYAYIFDVLNEYGKIDEEHGLLSIDEIKNVCSNIFKDYSVEFCYLFGSYAKGKENEKSDIDLFVSMDTNGMEYFDLVERLREELKKKVDLIHETQIKNNFELTKEILKDGIKIYG